MTTDPYQPPLQLKGEIMDLEFTVDTDHRKRRRNRTTASCLNCHTSKRKCDRKRPCQRCIQLGLTGLCVYEVDDPALRDDPNIDETTRLRNRIAELESLVRELRGKPHPRWADSNFRNGDPSEKWHSRATKTLPTPKRRAPSPELVEDQNPSHSHGRGPNGLHSTLLSPIKTESSAETAQLFRFSPSPAPSMRYHTFQSDVHPPVPASNYEGNLRSSYRGSTTSGSYHTSVPTPSSPYRSHPGSGPSSYSDGGNSYHLSGSDDGRSFVGDHYSGNSSPHPPFCPCRTSPALAHTYILLSQQLESTVHHIRQYSHHPPSSQCQLFRLITELNQVMQGIDSGECSRPAYDSNTPTDSEILTPLSASSGPTSFHSASPGGVSPQEWTTLNNTGYTSYFPVSAGDHGIYAHIVS
ncbi:MAG: hypothetical protein NXY57DRAFT_1111121 [Lentinula lateritia]|uniref:Zn(2)-C6 fungal-type domain-containing protein n=1 Tax=Lentinula lateritia TaxID=40482 RepID=A0ABQ8V3H3_9AGAR|nr:MAG: hypothetical protein NXY57DRAFT_1111121 [Lentinula lateritia]KAJ4464575.1 hypothetical protein C8R41DRAFT_926926 [Lentinula lateritia]